MPRFTRFTPDCESYLMHCVAVLLAILLARIVYRLMHMADKPPWVHELADLGVPARKTKISGTAVICGGSISGVITARICSDHFERVVVVDPEITRSLDGKMKARVLQYDSMHGYLSFFTNGLRCLWPDFDVEVAAAGGITSPADGQSHYSGVPIPAPHDQYAPLPMPQWVLLRRPGMERLLQKLLLRPATSQSSHIQTIDGTVKGLIRSSKGNNSIESVVIQDLSGRTISLGDVAFIADCTGTSVIDGEPEGED